MPNGPRPTPVGTSTKLFYGSRTNGSLLRQVPDEANHEERPASNTEEWSPGEPGRLRGLRDEDLPHRRGCLNSAMVQERASRPLLALIPATVVDRPRVATLPNLP